MAPPPETRPVGTPEPPFRWDVSKREQLGGLLAGWVPTISDSRLAELLTGSARVVAFCADGDLFFVGRSPDNLFDLLSGVFADTSWAERVHPLPVSLKWSEDVGVRAETRAALRRYLSSLDLAPGQINGRHRPTVLVDMVAEGRTFGELVAEWRVWAEEERISWMQLRRKLRLVGLTERTDTSPKTWRWKQHAAWTSLLPPRAIKNVSLSGELIYDMANRPKASRTFPPRAWGDPELAHPSRCPETLEALREAAYLYETGRAATTRARFVTELMRTAGVRSAWLRALAHELRANPGDSSGFVPVPDDTRPAVFMAERRERNKRRETARRQRRAAHRDGIVNLD